MAKKSQPAAKKNVATKSKKPVVSTVVEAASPSAKRSTSKLAARAAQMRARIRQRRSERRLASPHRSFRLTRRTEVPRYEAVRPWWQLMQEAWGIIRHSGTMIGLLVAIFMSASWLIIGVSGLQAFATLKQVVDIVFTEPTNGFDQAATLLQAATPSVSDQSLVTQGLLTLVSILFWLSFIWIARHAMAKQSTTLREAIYLSGTALVPSVLILLLMIIQMMPALLGGVLFVSASNSWTFELAPQAAFLVIIGTLLLIFSFYFVVSSFVALQVVALPGMYPWRALRDARALLSGRRLSTLRKVVILPVVLLIVWAVIMIPASAIDNKICGTGGESCWSTVTLLPSLTYALAGLSIAFSSIYAYILYRSLLATRESK